MGMYLICKKIHESTNVRVLLTGEISDELFGLQVHRFRALRREGVPEGVAEARARTCTCTTSCAPDRCISVNSMEARVPFGDLDFVRYVMRVDPALKLNTYGKGKYLLRKALKAGWLPENILWREKAAFSDAVGHSMVDDIKEYAEEKYGQRLEGACQKVRPITQSRSRRRAFSTANCLKSITPGRQE